MIRRTITALVAGLCVGAQAHAVEILADQEMGGVNIFAGNVLNILGAPAAGEVLMQVEEDAPPPPIEQTAGETAAISMALQAPNIDLNRPERDFMRDRDVAALVFPQPVLNVPVERNIASPIDTGGGMEFRILPGEQTIEASIVRQRFAPGESLRVVNNTRVDEIRVEDVAFREDAFDFRNQTLTITGLQVSAVAVISEIRR